MKLFAVLLVVCAALSYVKSDDDVKEKFNEIATECKEEAEASDDDLATVLKHEAATTTEAKCMRACMMKKYGIVDENSHLIKEAAEKVVKEFAKGDEEKEKHGMEILDKCVDLSVPEDHCEAAEAYSECMKSFLEEH